MDPHQDSGLNNVLRLVEEFSKSRDTNVLKKLADLVTQPDQGANATAGLQRLKSVVSKEEISTLILPALINGLDSSVKSTCRQSAIALADEFNFFAGPAIPALCRVATNVNEAVNAAPFAVEALGRLGKQASTAVPALIEILAHEELESGSFSKNPLESRPPRRSEILV
jgi:hypothetical protein